MTAREKRSLLRENVSRPRGWSADQTLWAELNRMAPALSWKQILLDSTRSHLIPKNATGVYLICASPPVRTVQDLYSVLYAGQVHSASHGLRARFLNHIQQPKDKLLSYLRCYFPRVDFWYTLLADAQEIDRLEALLIQVFSPPCNCRQAPGTMRLLAKIGSPVYFGHTERHRSP